MPPELRRKTHIKPKFSDWLTSNIGNTAVVKQSKIHIEHVTGCSSKISSGQRQAGHMNPIARNPILHTLL
jgi:hypothetical protein